MSDRPTFVLYQNLLAGTAAVDDNIDELVWPRDGSPISYRRQTILEGGDWAASFQFTAPDPILEKWRDEYLGLHFVEYCDGRPAFAGIVYAMRLTYNGQYQTISLERVFNRVSVRYQTNSGATETATAWADDATSQATYGVRELVVPAVGYMAAATAATWRDNLLARYKDPHVIADEVNFAPGAGVLSVAVIGYYRTLDWQTITDATKGTDAASDEITEIVTAADYVTAGTITTNALAIEQESDKEAGGARARRIASVGDAGGLRWSAAVYAGSELDYAPVYVTSISYFYDAKTTQPNRRRILYDENGAEVAPALVRPGRVAYARDLMPGRAQASTLIDDPRALLIERVEFTAEGVSLKGSGLDQVVAAPDPKKAAAVAIRADQAKKADRWRGLAASAGRGRSRSLP